MGTFASQLAKFAAETEETAHRVVRESVIEAGERLIVRSPAPEKGNPYSKGELISNWNYSLQSPDRSVSKRLNIRTVNYVDDLPKNAAGFIHYISNGVAHGYYVEVGTSQMDAQPMVGPTSVEWPALVAGVAARTGASK